MTTSHVHNPTIPLTKSDTPAVVSTASRVSLTSDESPSKKSDKSNEGAWNKMDFINTNPNMVSGRQREGSELKRSESYKLALNRKSGSNSIHSTYGDLEAIESGAGCGKMEFRDKYHTLPSRTNYNCSKTRGADHKNGSIKRNASQRSGVYPSPDTDEDQRSTEPCRKKKSRFTMIPQRFQKDKEHQYVKKKKSSTFQVHSSYPNISSHIDKTPTKEDIVSNRSQIETHLEQQPMSEECLVKGTLKDKSNISKHKGRSFFSSIRNSFRHKKAAEEYKVFNKASTLSKLVSPAVTESVQNDKAADKETHMGSQSSLIDNTDEEQIDMADEDADIIEEVEHKDSVTEIFECLIDPSADLKTQASYLLPSSGRGPDRSKLKLEGLRKYRPGSFKKDSAIDAVRDCGPDECDLSSALETDGIDFADGISDQQTQYTEGNKQLHESRASPEEHGMLTLDDKRNIGGVAKCLKLLGDQIADSKEKESEGSSPEVADGSQRRRLSSLEQELIQELRKFGDNYDKSFVQQKGCSYILQIVISIIKAQDYSKFKTAIHQEISNTIGWEQVAWYTYLIKTTMCIVGNGREMGQNIKRYATQYFSSTIKPWIESRPKGWESIHEETDVETECSELD